MLTQRLHNNNVQNNELHEVTMVTRLTSGWVVGRRLSEIIKYPIFSEKPKGLEIIDLYTNQIHQGNDMAVKQRGNNCNTAHKQY